MSEDFLCLYPLGSYDTSNEGALFSHQVCFIWKGVEYELRGRLNILRKKGKEFSYDGANQRRNFDKELR